MAIQLETTFQRFRGLSTDTKPGHSEKGPPKGSIFIETDTGHRYVWTGSWPWARQEQTVEGFLAELIDQNAQIVALLAAMIRGHEEYLWENDTPPE